MRLGWPPWTPTQYFNVSGWYVLPFLIVKAYLYLGKIFFNSYDQLVLLFITVIILKGFNLLHDFDLVWFNWENKSSSKISMIRLIPRAIVVMILNLQLIFFFSLLFINERSTFFSTLSILGCDLLDNTDFTLTQTLLFGNTCFKSNKNQKILIATINFIS